MAIRRRKFIEGIRLKGSTNATAAEGELRLDPSALKFKAYVDGAERSIVTEDQDQTLTNKTIDGTVAGGANNIVKTDSVKVAYDDTIETVISLENAEDPAAPVENVQEAIDSIKRALDNQNEASEIDFTPTADIPSEKVQGAIEDVQSNLQAHLDDPSAHNSDSIDYTPAVSADWDTDPTKVDEALDQLSSRLSTSEVDLGNAKNDINDLIQLSGVDPFADNLGTFTGNIISDNTTVKGALQELETQSTTNASTLGSHIANTTSAHGVMGAVVGTLNFQTIKFKQYEGASFRKMQKEAAEDNTQSGTDVVLTEPTDPIVRLLGDVTPLESIAGISQASYAAYQVVTLVNVTANDIEIKNNTGTTAEERILTGTDDDITLAPDAALFLKYDATSSRWRVIGGTGGASTVVKGTAGENLTALQFAALDLDGNIYKLDASNDDRIESVGIVKADALSTESVKTITSGIIKGFTGLTVGAPLYADPLNAGGYTQTEPSDSSFNNKWVIRLGIAISATQVLLNPDQGASAYFKDELSSKPSITNNQSVSANVQDLIFDGTQVRGAVVKYTIYRTTDTQEVAQIGDFKVIYKSIEGSWSLGADNYHGDNAGVNFTITNSGQVQYTSTDLTGANYSGVLDYSVTELFKI